jgi:tripartite-type tricarboxylate transporter receptor subunit TctC
VLKSLRSCLVASLLLTLSSWTLADAAYPNKPIRLVVPYPPGGTVEVMARAIGEELTKAWGQPVVIDSKPGASGSIGSALVARAPADGYTLVFGTQSTHGTNSLLFKDVGYDPVKDFEPVSMVAAAPLLLVVNPKVPVNNARELVAHIRKQPQGLNYASASTGGGGHLAGEMFARAQGLQLVHVPYKGSGPARSDLIAGHVPFMFDNIASSLPAVQQGQLRALAVTSAARTGAAPDLPTMQEAGVDDVIIDTWYAVYAPAGTPRSIVQKLSSEVVRILRLPNVATRFKGLGLDIVASTPEELASRMRSDLQRYGKIIREANIRAE